jgi:hypothetical protein
MSSHHGNGANQSPHHQQFHPHFMPSTTTTQSSSSSSATAPSLLPHAGLRAAASRNEYATRTAAQLVATAAYNHSIGDDGSNGNEDGMNYNNGGGGYRGGGGAGGAASASSSSSSAGGEPNRTKWSAEEDDALRKAVSRHGAR